jgi:predicted DNA-binding transcriptional regulator AlpA
MTSPNDRDRLISDIEASQRYGFALKTWRNWRFNGKGPAVYKIGRTCRYKISDIEAWLDSHRVPAKSLRKTADAERIVRALRRGRQGAAR